MSEAWSDLVTGVAAALTCGAVALLMPALVARLPEPEPVPDPEEGVEPTYAQQLVLAEGPKEPYAEMAAAPGFARNLVACAAVAGGLMGWAIGWHAVLALVLPWAPVGALLALVDLRTRLLPAVVVRAALGGVLLYGALAWALDDARVPLVRGAIGLLVAWLVYAVFWFVSPRGLGFGDVRLAGPLGFTLAYLGWGRYGIGMYAPFLIFALPALVLAVVRWDRSLLKAQYPFGPAMLAGLVIGVVAGADPLHLVAG